MPDDPRPTRGVNFFSVLSCRRVPDDRRCAGFEDGRIDVLALAPRVEPARRRAELGERLGPRRRNDVEPPQSRLDVGGLIGRPQPQRGRWAEPGHNGVQ